MRSAGCNGRGWKNWEPWREVVAPSSPATRSTLAPPALDLRALRTDHVTRQTKEDITLLAIAVGSLAGIALIWWLG